MIYGIGINDVDEPTFYMVGGKKVVLPDYNLWKNTIKRTIKTGARPTYEEASVHPDWLTFSTFKSWYKENHHEGLALDKDLLVVGNKEYGPDTCRFVPQELNNLFLVAARTRGEYPLGVYVDKRTGRFRSEVYSLGIKKSLGSYATPESAHKAWQLGKISAIRERLEWYKGHEYFLQDVYEACMGRVDSLERDFNADRETFSL